MDAVPSCCDCGEIIYDDVKAIQCERCVENETWKCANCLELSDELYEQLATSSKSSLHWFCDKCEATVMELDTHTSDKISPIFEKIGVYSCGR